MALWLVLAIGTTGLLAALVYGWQPELLRDLIEQAGSGVLEREVRIARLEGSLLEELVLHGVSIAPPADTEGVTAPEERFEVQSLRVRLAIGRSLLRRGLILRRVEVEGVRLQLSRDEDGRWLAAGLSDPRSEPSDTPDEPLRLPVRVALRELVLRGGRLELSRDARSGLEDVALDVDVRASGLLWRRGLDPEWPQELRASIALQDGRLRGNPLGRGESEWTLAGGRLGLDALVLRGPLGALSATGEALLEGTPLSAGLVEAGLHLAVEELDVSRLETAEPLPSSSIAAEIDLRLAPPDPQSGNGRVAELAATLLPSTLMTGRLTGGELQARYVFGSGDWSFENAWIGAEAGRVSATGRGRRGEVEALELVIRNLELAKLPPAWTPLPELHGSINVDARLSGPALAPVGTIGITATELAAQGLGPAELHVELTALGDGHYLIDVLEAAVNDDAEQMAGAFLRSERPTSIRLDQQDDVLELEVDSLELVWSGGSLALSGGIHGGQLLPTHVDVRSLDLDVVGALAGVPRALGGQVNGTIELGGDPIRPEVEAELLWRDPLMQGLEAESVEIGIITRGELLYLDVRVAQQDLRELHVKLELPISEVLPPPRVLAADPRTKLEMRARRFDLAWLDPILIDLKLRGSGIIDGELVARGGRPFPYVTGDVHVSGGRLYGLPPDTPGTDEGTFGPIDGRLTFSGHALSIEGMQLGEDARAMLLSTALAWHEATQELDFEVTIQGVGFQGRLEASGGARERNLRPTVVELFDFDAEELAAIWDLNVDLGGDLSARLELEGPLEHPLAVLEARWDRPRIARNQSDMVTLSARADAGGLTLDGGFTRQERREIVWSGWRPLDPERPLHQVLLDRDGWLHDVRNVLILEAKRFDLSWLALLVPDLPLRSRGWVDGHAQVRGGHPIPAVYGELQLSEGMFSIANQRARVGRLDGLIRLTGYAAELPQLHLDSRRGFAEIRGRWDWSGAGMGDADLEIAFDNYLFNQLGLLRTYIDGRLTATGPLDGLNVGGRVELKDVRVSFPSPEDPVLKEIRVQGLPDRSASASIYEEESQIAGLDAKTAVDVTFALNRGTWVRGMGLDAEILGEVQVSKAPYGELHYSGTLEVIEGRYSLRGKRFDLEYGTAIFTGDPRPIPDVDIVGVRQVSRDVRVTAHLTGPADQPRLELFSEPPMDTAEIISYVYFGRGREDAGAASTTDQLSSVAASMAGVMLLDNMAPELRETLRIDQISVTSSETEDAPAVEVESQITPNVYLRLIQSLGPTADEGVEVRWRFYKDFSIKSRVNRSGASSVDLLWEYDYWGLESYGLRGLKRGPGDRVDTGGCQPPLRCPDEEDGRADDGGGTEEERGEEREEADPASSGTG